LQDFSETVELSIYSSFVKEAIKVM